jgi:hypothetical protein
MRPTESEVVTDDPQALNAVMESIEAGALQLSEASGNHAAPSFETVLEPMAEVHTEAVRQQVPTAKRSCVADQLLEIQPDGCVVRSDHRAGADADDHVKPNTVTNQLPNYADVSGTPQPARAQNEPDANRPRDSWNRTFTHCRLRTRSRCDRIRQDGLGGTLLCKSPAEMQRMILAGQLLARFRISNLRVVRLTLIWLDRRARVDREDKASQARIQ